MGPPSSSSSSSGSVGKLAFVEGVSGAAAGVVTELIFYGLDTYKVMMQAGKPFNMSRLFKGAVPMALMGSAPSFGVFFAVYNPVKNVLENQLRGAHQGAATGAGAGVASSMIVLAASVAGGVPSSIVAVPADVLKKQLVLGKESMSLTEAARHILKMEGHAGFFRGWQANLIKDVPFAGIKMTLYEGIASLYMHFKPNHARSLAATGGRTSSSDLSPMESAGVGLASGVATAILTCPIDCVNTRIKSGELARFSVVGAHLEIVRKDGITALFRGIAPRTVILGFGSTVFWWFFAKIKNVIDAPSE
jgi:solute carrier family 25 (mitochondrial S-adenosylmethionine transporter), member 26